jgi:hypothetical protein
MQERLDNDTAEGEPQRFAAPVQLYSDGTLLDNKNAKAHPLLFSLMNITTNKRLTSGIRSAANVWRMTPECALISGTFPVMCMALSLRVGMPYQSSSHTQTSRIYAKPRSSSWHEQGEVLITEKGCFQQVLG